MERVTVDGDETTALRPTGETRVACGWCGHPTAPGTCGYCGRDPSRPYLQRGIPVVHVPMPKAGRPGLDDATIRARLREATEILGPDATVQEIAEQLGVDPRTVRRWKVAVDGR